MNQEHVTTVYERLGGHEPLHRLVQRFYDLMEIEPAFQVLRSRHGSDLQSARQRLEMFLSGWMGGPPLYEQAFGHPRLRARHLPFSIGIEERDQWLQCMDQAMQETGVNQELRLRLNASFFQTADWMRNQ